MQLVSQAALSKSHQTSTTKVTTKQQGIHIPMVKLLQNTKYRKNQRQRAVENVFKWITWQGNDNIVWLHLQRLNIYIYIYIYIFSSIDSNSLLHILSNLGIGYAEHSLLLWLIIVFNKVFDRAFNQEVNSLRPALQIKPVYCRNKAVFNFLLFKSEFQT